MPSVLELCQVPSCADSPPFRPLAYAFSKLTLMAYKIVSLSLWLLILLLMQALTLVNGHLTQHLDLQISFYSAMLELCFAFIVLLFYPSLKHWQCIQHKYNVVLHVIFMRKVCVGTGQRAVQLYM